MRRFLLSTLLASLTPTVFASERIDRTDYLSSSTEHSPSDAVLPVSPEDTYSRRKEENRVAQAQQQGQETVPLQAKQDQHAAHEHGRFPKFVCP